MSSDPQLPYSWHLITIMAKLIPYIAALLALGQVITAAKAVTSFSQWVDGILEDPNGDNMTPEEVIAAFKSGNFSTPTAGKSIVNPIYYMYIKLKLL